MAVFRAALKLVFSLIAILLQVYSANAEERITVQLSWSPAPEFGCFYQAQAENLYQQAGLTVELRPGGPKLNVEQTLLTGKADVGVASFAQKVFIYEQEKLPLVAIGALFQRSPLALISRTDRDLSTLEEFSGVPIFMSAHSRLAVWPMLKKLFNWNDEQARDYMGTLELPLSLPKAAILGFVSSEPARFRAAGVEPKVLLLADHGFDDYAYLLAVGKATLDTRRSALRAFVKATFEGCRRYLGSNYLKAHELIGKENQDLTAPMMDEARLQLLNNRILGSADQKDLARMLPERWKKMMEAGRTTGAYGELAHWQDHVDFNLAD